MAGTMSRDANAEPNLTPLLDMVFQLITFFMLVINFKSAAMDLTLKLPVLGSARPVDTKGQQDLLVLNIDSQGRLKVDNRPEPEIERYISAEAQWTMRTNLTLKPGDPLPTTVVVRADRATPFHLLNRVIKACQDNGFRNFTLKAMTKAEQP